MEIFTYILYALLACLAVVLIYVLCIVAVSFTVDLSKPIEKQSRLFYEYIDEKLKAGWDYSDAFYKAKTRIALPGASEHHTGLAVDIVGMSHQSLDDAQANTKEAKWLEEHCAEYGFILRYPKDKTDITGVDYESWHFRYVGEDAAAYMMKNDLTLEEFLEEVDKL